MNDGAKIILKQRLEEQELRQSEYETKDDVALPGWTFFLREVIKAYGVCPFLNVFDPGCNGRRATWLVSQIDGGEVYRRAVALMTDEDVVCDLKGEITRIKSDLEALARASVSKVALPITVTFDELIQNVYKRRDAKSQNKKSKECWTMTLRCLDAIANESGIDFAKYVYVHTGYQFKYKVPERSEGQPLNGEFMKRYDDFLSQQGRLHSLQLSREREVTHAKKQLTMLIATNFQIAQTGRYYRRWLYLSPEKKDERIASYCYWFMRERGYTVGAAEAMKAFIIDKLDRKEMKVGSSGLDWNGKQGIITTAPVEYDPDTHRFSITVGNGQQAKKKRSARKKIDDIFQGDLKAIQTRANRLMLYEIVRSGCTHRDTVVNAVIRNLRCRVLPTPSVRAYLSTRYDDIVSAIKEDSRSID